MNHDIMSICLQAFRIIFIIGFPVLLGVLLGGLLAGAFQGATSIKDPVIGYTGRLLGALIAMYMVLPATIDSVLEFSRLVIGP